jgi:Ca2+-binding RTX toxin-like protein
LLGREWRRPCGRARTGGGDGFRLDARWAMIVSGVVSIPSSVGSSTVFTVTGTRTLEYAQAFQAYLVAALKGGTLNIVQGDSTAGGVTYTGAVSGQVNEAVLIDSTGGGLSTTVPGGYQFLFDAVNGASTITGSAAGSDVLVEGTNAAATFRDQGGNNSLVFVDGNNLYVGDTTASAGTDHIVAGSGFDTIDAGYGATTVDSGTGHASITLNDTAGGAIGSFTDFAYLDDGASTVYANGLRDAVVATAPGQTVDGGVGTGQYDGIVLLDANGAGDDVVNGGAATVALFDDAGGTSVFGGSGLLYFIGGANVSASIVGGGGTTDIYGASGDSVTFASADTDGTAVFVAGFGNETLNGALAQGGTVLYGGYSDEASVAAAINDVLTGGAGNDTLISGAGFETLTGGAGNNAFIIDANTDGAGAHITITDFGASAGNLVGFENYSASQIENALNGATTVMGAGGTINTVLTLSDNTQVTFIGVSSLTGHTVL